MIDLSEKEHYGKFDGIVKLCEAAGYEVVCYKETYEYAKCLIGGWDIPISHHAENANRYYDKIVKPQIENGEKLLEAGLVSCRSIDLPKFKRIKARLGR
jgi:hypothetical protein